MNYKETIRPISYVKANTAETLKFVSENKSPMIVTQNGEARAVLLDIESYQNMKNAFSLLSIIKIGEDEIKRGEYQDAETVFEELENKYFRE